MLKNYFVDDLVPSPQNVKILFVLESPYKEEVKNGYPVAGLSGREITNLLSKIDPSIEKGIPFGKYLYTNRDSRFGIVNCSNLPLDIKTYAEALHQNKMLNSFDRIRRNPKTSPNRRQNITDKEVHQKLLTELRDRLQSILTFNKNIIVVTCGNLAKYFVQLTGSEILHLVAVPHPSFNQWRHQKNLKIIEELKIILTKNIL